MKTTRIASPRRCLTVLCALTALVAVPMALAGPDDHGHAPAAKSKPSTPAKPAAAHAPESDEHATPPAKSAPSGKASDPHAAAPKAAAKTATKSTSKSEPRPANADEALAELNAGNARWAAAKPTDPGTSIERRAETASGQHPFVTVLTCADSRLPVERIFDQGVGDVFVVRVAGNVVGEHTAGTIEYGLEHLHTPLLVVMGHTKCGAVKATCAGGHAGGNIDSLLADIAPAVDRARSAHADASEDELVEFAVRENVWQSVYDLLKTSSPTREMVGAGKVKVVGAVCDIATGKVEFLGEHPWQAQLLDALATAPAQNIAAHAAERHAQPAAPKAAEANEAEHE